MLILEAVEDITKLALVVAGLDLALGIYVHHRQPAWTGPLDRRRVTILWLLV
jgi:hypothetical protein